MRAPGGTAIEKKLNLEQALRERQQEVFNQLATQGKNSGKLFLLNRQASGAWLNSICPREGEGPAAVPSLTAAEQAMIVRCLKERESFQPWTHHLVETISALPYIKRRFPYQEYIQKVGRLEADGWLVRVYVNHEDRAEA